MVVVQIYGLAFPIDRKEKEFQKTVSHPSIWHIERIPLK